jgi:hypothetical protein
MVLRNPNTGEGARFNLGVFALEAPEFQLAESPSSLTFSGLDLLYFLDQPIGDSYEMPIGSDPVVVAASLIAAAVPGATVNFVPSGASTTVPFTWPYSEQEAATYLSVVNDMLALVGYLGVWVDWDGVFQLVPYVQPSIGTVEWVFDLSATDNVVSEQRTAAQSFFNVPNWWRFTMQNLTETPTEGTNMLTYIDEDPDNPGSYPNRGRYIKKTLFVDAASWAGLVAQAAVTIAADLSPAETFNVSTSPFPLAWHRDLIRMVDPSLADLPPNNSTVRRVLARSWEITLDGSADMTWTWETVSATEVA